MGLQGCVSLSQYVTARTHACNIMLISYTGVAHVLSGATHIRLGALQPSMTVLAAGAGTHAAAELGRRSAEPSGAPCLRSDAARARSPLGAASHPRRASGSAAQQNLALGEILSTTTSGRMISQTATEPKIEGKDPPCASPSGAVVFKSAAPGPASRPRPSPHRRRRRPARR